MEDSQNVITKKNLEIHQTNAPTVFQFVVKEWSC
jgi:hypothetical protein